MIETDVETANLLDRAISIVAARFPDPDQQLVGHVLVTLRMAENARQRAATKKAKATVPNT